MVPASRKHVLRVGHVEHVSVGSIVRNLRTVSSDVSWYFQNRNAVEYYQML